MSRFNTRSALGAAAAVCVLVLAACGGAQQSTGTGIQSSTQDGSTSAGDGAPQTVTITVRTGEFGDYLVDSSGATVYLYTKDSQGASKCSAGCLKIWPAVLGTPQAGEGVDASKLGTIQRESGKAQLTYAGHPLYYYAKDTAPGQIAGQGVKDVWYLVSPDGTAIKQQSSDGGGIGY